MKRIKFSAPMTAVRHKKHARGVVGLAILFLIFIADVSSHRASAALVYGLNIEITGLFGTGFDFVSIGDTAVLIVNLNPDASASSTSSTIARYPLISLDLTMGTFSKIYETGVDFLADHGVLEVSVKRFFSDRRCGNPGHAR